MYPEAGLHDILPSLYGSQHAHNMELILALTGNQSGL